MKSSYYYVNTWPRYIVCVRCLKNVSNVVKFNIFDMLSAIALPTILLQLNQIWLWNWALQLFTVGRNIYKPGHLNAWLWFRERSWRCESLKSSRYNVMSPLDPISCVCYFRNVIRFKKKEIINVCSWGELLARELSVGRHKIARGERVFLKFCSLLGEQLRQTAGC